MEISFLFLWIYYKKCSFKIHSKSNKSLKKQSENDLIGISLIIAMNQIVVIPIMPLWQTTVIIHFGNEWALFSQDEHDMSKAAT